MRVRWLKTAIRNLDLIAAYIAKDDEDLARKISDYIHMRVEGLEKLPEQGRPGRIFGTRELVIERYSYIIPYRIRGDEIQIIRVFHTSRKIPDSW